MATITLKNIPAPVHRALKRRAAANSRSLNREAIACLENLLLSKPVERGALLERIRERRRRVGITVDDKWLHWAKHQGRP